MACAFEVASTPPSSKRPCTEQRSSHGFLYEGSPVALTSSALFETAKEEGSRILKGSLCETEYPSPNSIYFSHTRRHLETLAKLAKAKDVDGILSLVHGKELSTSEQVIDILGKSLKEVKEEMHVLKELSSLGTSSLILVFDCLKGLESTISKVYQEQLNNLPSGVHAKFGQIVKDFQKRQKDGLVKKTTVAAEVVCKKIGMITFSAALYDFVCHYNQYKMNEKDTFTKDDARTLVRPLLHLYQNIMKRFVGQVQAEDNSFKELEGGFNTLQEWHALYMLRIERDHHGGHCASWWNGYPNEGNRLRRVKAVFEKLMHCQSPELRHFSMLQRLVVPSLESYIVKKEARAERVADPSVDGGAFEKSDCEWLQAWI